MHVCVRRVRVGRRAEEQAVACRFLPLVDVQSGKRRGSEAVPSNVPRLPKSRVRSCVLDASPCYPHLTRARTPPARHRALAMPNQGLQVCVPSDGASRSCAAAAQTCSAEDTGGAVAERVPLFKSKQALHNGWRQQRRMQARGHRCQAGPRLPDGKLGDSTVAKRLCCGKHP